MSTVEDRPTTVIPPVTSPVGRRSARPRPRPPVERPEPAPVAPPTEDAPRRIGGWTSDEIASLAGSVLAGCALGWVVYERLVPADGLSGLLVTCYLAVVLVYGSVCWIGNPGITVVDRMAALLVTSAAGVVVGALLLVVGYTFWAGREALVHLNLITEDLEGVGPLDPLSEGGALHAIVGTLVMIGIAIAITVPLGIGCALYLSEVGGRASKVVRTVVESMTALPSIVAGLFIYATFILLLGNDRSGLAAALAISVMMLPIIARASEVVLRVVPNGLREASLALGASQWRTVWTVVLPTARPGLTTAVILGTARGLGETSPVLLTAGYTTFVNANPVEGLMISLPLLTFFQSRSPEEVENIRAFGSASVLMFIVLILFGVARAATSNRSTR